MLVTDFADYVSHMELERLGTSDVWHRSMRFADDARFLYELSVDDPKYPYVDGAAAGFPEKTQPDPKNKNVYRGASPHLLSTVELPTRRRSPSPRRARGFPTDRSARCRSPL